MTVGDGGKSTTAGRTVPSTTKSSFGCSGSLVRMLALLENFPLNSCVSHVRRISVDSFGFRTAESLSLKLTIVHEQVEVPFLSRRSPGPSFVIVQTFSPVVSCAIVSK